MKDILLALLTNENQWWPSSYLILIKNAGKNSLICTYISIPI